MQRFNIQFSFGQFTLMPFNQTENLRGEIVQQTAALLPAGITPTDGLESAVSQTLQFTVVGASYDDHLIEDAGAVYVYENISGNWSQTINAPDAAVADHFGSPIETHGDRMFISAINNENDGAVYAYHYNGTNGNLLRN